MLQNVCVSQTRRNAKPNVDDVTETHLCICVDAPLFPASSFATNRLRQEALVLLEGVVHRFCALTHTHTPTQRLIDKTNFGDDKDAARRF